MAGSESVDVSADERSAFTVELEPADSRRPPARHRHRRVFRAGLGLTAAACVAIFAVVVTRDGNPRDDVRSSQGMLPPIGPNGWVAFAQAKDASSDIDVYLVREGTTPRRVAGSDTDTSDQVCPAFSPDGERLLFGQATGTFRDGHEDDAELVITEVGADGSTSGTTTLPLEGLSVPPCAIWSPDGRWVTFGAGSEVWLVDTVTEELRRLPGYAATDLDWRPGTDELAIAANGIHIYSVTTGEVLSLGVEGAEGLAWSPDGSTIAVARVSRVGSGEAEHDETSLWLVDADGTNERQLTAAYRTFHGVGPVWSPDGKLIAYQRLLHPQHNEAHEVVLVAADDNDPGTPLGTEVVIPAPVTPGADPEDGWLPWSVTWSPDGSMLLYNAWTYACSADVARSSCPEVQGLVAVPVDTTKAPIVLAEGISVKDGEPWLPIQTWGREPLG